MHWSKLKSKCAFAAALCGSSQAWHACMHGEGSFRIASTPAESTVTAMSQELERPFVSVAVQVTVCEPTARPENSPTGEPLEVQAITAESPVFGSVALIGPVPMVTVSPSVSVSEAGHAITGALDTSAWKKTDGCQARRSKHDKA
jgi:hypothetical protein